MPEHKEKARSRNAKGQFTKGNTGNPCGRPKVNSDVKKLLKEASVDAIQVLIDTMKDPDVKPELRKNCAEAILDRVYGKNSQLLEEQVDSTIRLVLEEGLGEYAK